MPARPETSAYRFLHSVKKNAVFFFHALSGAAIKPAEYFKRCIAAKADEPFFDLQVQIVVVYFSVIYHFLFELIPNRS